MKIRLDKKAVSWNKIYSGKHWSWRKKLRDEWGEFIYFSLLKNKVKRVAYTHRIDIKIIAYQKRTLDPDNICSKLIIDGLRIMVL